MGAHMKTTIDIADSLLLHAKQVAAAQDTTVRALVEAGLRQVLQQRQARGPSFALRQASFKGKGLQADAAGASWDGIRERAYEGRGGAR